MARPRGPLFLERAGYRRRRLMDAARVLPVAGLVAVLLPILWSRDGQTSTAWEAVYLFGLWAALILVAGLMSGRLRDEQEREAAHRRRAPAPPPGRD